MASRYNELEKVSAVETFQNELGGFKVDERSFHFGPRKSARQCAGINRHTVGDESALQERNSETILASSFAVAIVR